MRSRLIFFGWTLFFSLLLLLAIFGRPSYQERLDDCVKNCAAHKLFGRLEPQHLQYGRSITDSYECKCY